MGHFSFNTSLSRTCERRDDKSDVSFRVGFCKCCETAYETSWEIEEECLIKERLPSSCNGIHQGHHVKFCLRKSST